MATDFRRWAARQGAPFTLALVASLAAAALAGLLTQGGAVASLALTDPGGRSWSLLTYPWAIAPLGSAMGLVSLIFLLVLLFQFGSSIEGEMGTGRYAAFWAAAILLFALVASALGFGLAGPWLPAAALVVAWGARNPSAQVMIYGILPVRGTWLAGLAALGVVVGYAGASPFAALALLAPLGLAWLFAADKLPLAYSAAQAARRRVTAVRGARQYDESYFEDVKKREIEREERERLRKLFEGK